MEISEQNFDEVVSKAELPILVDFWAPWCAPCRQLSPILDEIAEELDGKLLLGKVNIDEQQSLAMRFGIMTIPTMMLFKDGDVVSTLVGARPKQDVKSELAAHL